MATASSRASIVRAERFGSVAGRNSGVAPARSRGGGGAAPPKRSLATSSSRSSLVDSDNDFERVRVAIRLRPKNAEELSLGSDFTACVELQPELRRLKLKRNNWSSEYHRFDEVFTECASQKRVYEAVAKPVVESVLNGYNGTVMAYGQTGTGKTYTVGQHGKEDPSQRGIMVRALEDILAEVIPGFDTVAVSYLQLYLESIEDLLAPDRTNIPIVEDPKLGDITLPGAEVVEIKDIDQFRELLQFGEANRHAANTKMNTESSRSHAILMVYIQRSSRDMKENMTSMSNCRNNGFSTRHVPLVLRSKLLIVDLAGSERINKSGSEGHMLEEAKFINLSLTSLGKCINALAESTPHIPTRDSKLTRLLRDSFGGTARTSLIITIGPCVQHYSETASTIMFGQRAMRVLNTIKLKEEFDYESLCRRLGDQIDFLTSEIERQQKLRRDERFEFENKLKTCQASYNESEMALALKVEYLEKENARLELDLKRLEDENNLMLDEISHLKLSSKQNKDQHQLETSTLVLENSTFQKVLADTTQMYEKKLLELIKQLEDEDLRFVSLEEKIEKSLQSLDESKKLLQVQEKEKAELNMKIEELRKLNEESSTNINSLKEANTNVVLEKELLRQELSAYEHKLLNEEMRRKFLQDEVLRLRKDTQDDNIVFEAKRQPKTQNLSGLASGLGTSAGLADSNMSREAVSGQRIIYKIFEEVGISKVLTLLRCEDLDVQIYAVKMVANLAAEDKNQEIIVEEGGLDALFMLLESSENAILQRVTAGAIANLAMNGPNQGVIVSKGGARLLASVALRTDDPQTLRMVAGALANLCGNEKLHLKLKEEGGIKALMEMVKCGHDEVIAQVARGLANFAKCESRGNRRGRSLLIGDGILSWMVANSMTFLSSTRRHIELAICHLAQNEENTADIVSSGAVDALVRISKESSREDIRNLAKKTLHSNQAFPSLVRRR